MAFLINASCDGCSACARQCPTWAITGTFKKQYVIDPGNCIDCGVCGQICHIDAVVDNFGKIAQRVPKNERLRPVVNLDACNGCGLCVDFCPFDCLRVIGGPNTGVSVLVRPLACVSCDECSDICLKRAVTMKPVALTALSAESAREHALAYLEEFDRGSQGAPHPPVRAPSPLPSAEESTPSTTLSQSAPAKSVAS